MPNPPALSLTPDFDVFALHYDISRIWVLDANWTSWAKAVDDVGDAMCSLRTYSPPDHNDVIKWISGIPISTVERAVFGLPIPYRYSSGENGVVQGRPENKRLHLAEINRRASPLWLKISKTNDQKYVVVATLFKSAFLPKGEKLHLARSSSPPVAPPPNYNLIETWLTSSFSAAEEVK